MIALSFLGTGNYSKITYSFEEKSFETDFFPEAVLKFFEVEKLYVLLTEEADEKNGCKLKERISFEPVRITSGKTRDEMWDIFDRIVNAVPQNSEVIFDITHGFRSQPLLAIASIIYLKTIKNVKIVKLLYGAYEAKTDNVAPVFDLKPFLDLMEWSYSAYEFLKHGNTGEFKNILADSHRNTYLGNDDYKAKSLSSAGNVLQKFSNSLSLVNILQVLKSAYNFMRHKASLNLDIENVKSARPFSLILNEVASKLEPFSRPYDPKNNKEFLNSKIAIIKWYLDTENYQQAITLICETFISFYCIKKNKDIFNKESRECASFELGEIIKKMRNKDNLTEKEIELGELWNNISQTRNKINHAYMRETNEEPEDTIIKIKKYYDELVEYINKNPLCS